MFALSSFLRLLPIAGEAFVGLVAWGCGGVFSARRTASSRRRMVSFSSNLSFSVARTKAASQ